MYGTISVVNNGRQVISILVDDEMLFCDILPGESTRKKPILSGTRRAIILNSREIISADVWFSVQKNVHTTLKIYSCGVLIL